MTIVILFYKNKNGDSTAQPEATKFATIVKNIKKLKLKRFVQSNVLQNNYFCPKLYQRVSYQDSIAPQIQISRPLHHNDKICVTNSFHFCYDSLESSVKRRYLYQNI